MKAKKVLAMLMASAMIMGMSITAFAADIPKEEDSMNVSSYIKNVDPKATITAYQIIDAEYNANGFTGYKWVAGDMDGQDVTFDEFGNVNGLDDTYITKLASNPSGLVSADAKSEELAAGTWMLLVSDVTDGKVYNPMIISVYYTTSGSDNTMDVGEVDASDDWGLATKGAYEKSSEVSITKLVKDNDGKGGDDQAAVGDTVEYTIRSEIPSYSASSAARFEITDTIKNGLAYELTDGTVAPVVKVGDNVLDSQNYTINMNSDKSFTIKFKSEYVKGLAQAGTNRKVTVTYQATVTSEAITNPAQNTATVTYDAGSKTADEYVYSVSFDGVVKKVNENHEGLAGATFTLYKTWNDANRDESITADELSNAVGISETEEGDYDIDFFGLDADQIYYLTETAAPGEYSINDHVYKIEFRNFNEDDKTYDVYLDGRKVTTIIYGQEATGSDYEIVNTKLADLPGTGGIGTTIFTIGGCAVMVTAAGLYFASRRKNQEN